ncbi:polysaccharide biosynthesis tyrosine autokinase [Brachybacterium sp. NBEC-018]|uniref:polysaccharide biosynthesis tyrosine autokinase n=1 Tax=Brachybacterium sp. NBEC-018 TaxID=2996004 RepID=UPI0021754FFD|nr:polysaccharide biosynthesis tyrosine autokinase [Brachybacterium sp. NBEC-018]UVY84828.1 polysaccharide biosynthesis tyrosine autokinase [Brachybacterium sp. NBEC-018]
MTIEDFLRLLLRNLLLLIVVTVLGAAAGFGLSFTRPTVYSATALGYVSASAQTDADGNAISQASGNMDFQYSKAQSYLPLFGTRAVGERIVGEVGLDQSPDSVAGSLQATLDPNAPIITVTAFAGDPQQASDIADAAVEATAAEARELESGGSEDAQVSVQLTPYQNALVPGAPVSPDRKKYLAAGAAGGLLIALGLAWLRDRNDSRIRTAKDLTDSLDLPLLGMLPDSKEMQRAKNGTLGEPKAFATREAIRKLRTNLRYIDVDNPPRSIVVTSSAPGEGKSTVAANLARVMARAGQPTILVDADLRRPMIASEFGIDGAVGLSQLLAGSVSIEDAVATTPTRNLTVLPAGQVPPNPSELLGSRRMKELLEELSRDHFVILDAPPVLAVTDAQLLSRHADGAMLVAVAGTTRRQALERAVEAIGTVGAKVHGVVLNRASASRFTRIAYGDTAYGYAYGYGRKGYGLTGYGVETVPDEGALAEAPVVAAEPASGAGATGAGSSAGAAAVAGTPASSVAPTTDGATADGATTVGTASVVDAPAEATPDAADAARPAGRAARTARGRRAADPRDS